MMLLSHGAEAEISPTNNAIAAEQGVAITAVSILITLGDGPRMAWLRHQPAFTQTRFVYMTAIRALGAATLVFTALIALDDGHELDAWLAGVAAGVLLLVVVRLCWVIWLMNRLVGLATQDQAVSPDHIVPLMSRRTSPACPRTGDTLATSRSEEGLVIEDGAPTLSV
jgi:hypothetical protein